MGEAEVDKHLPNRDLSVVCTLRQVFVFVIQNMEVFAFQRTVQYDAQLGTRTLFGNFFGNIGLISLEKNFRAKFANDVIFNA